MKVERVGKQLNKNRVLMFMAVTACVVAVVLFDKDLLHYVSSHIKQYPILTQIGSAVWTLIFYWFCFGYTEGNK